LKVEFEIFNNSIQNSALIIQDYFLNLLLANPANPRSPDPRSSMVAGSGMGGPLPAKPVTGYPPVAPGTPK